MGSLTYCACLIYCPNPGSALKGSVKVGRCPYVVAGTVLRKLLVDKRQPPKGVLCHATALSVVSLCGLQLVPQRECTPTLLNSEEH